MSTATCCVNRLLLPVPCQADDEAETVKLVPPAPSRSVMSLMRHAAERTARRRPA